LQPLGGSADPRHRLEKTQVGGFAPVHGSAHPMHGVLQTQASRFADLGAKVSKLQVGLQTASGSANPRGAGLQTRSPRSTARCMWSTILLCPTKQCNP